MTRPQPSGGEPLAASTPTITGSLEMIPTGEPATRRSRAWPTTWPLGGAGAGSWAWSEAWRGTALAGLGVLVFSGSFPAAVFAMQGFDPYLVAVGRAVIAAAAAVVFLLAAKVPLLPPRAHLRSYAVIVVGVVLGFPVLSGLALHAGAGTAHSAVVIGLLPAVTAACAVVRAGERPQPLFWVACLLGALCLTAFTLSRGGGSLTTADLLLIVSLAFSAIGYTEGGRLSRDTPGWQVVSYALVLATPVTVPVSVALFLTTGPRPTAVSVAGFAYAGLFSMFLGFVVWYAGLAMGGIARAGQVQLMQPLLTLVWAWLIMGERFGGETIAAAVAVLVCITVTQRSRA